MTEIPEIKSLFNHALKHAFEKRKVFFLGSVLVLCGFFFLFCHLIGLLMGKWATWSLTVFALFLCLIPLLAAQVVLVHTYAKERMNESFSLRVVFTECWEQMGTAAMLGLPLLLGSILATLLLGVFILLIKIPVIGIFFSVVLSFGPYLLLICTFILGIAALCLFFFIVPALSLKKNQPLQTLLSTPIKSARADVFSTVVFLFIGIFPPLVLGKILYAVGHLTHWLYFTDAPFVGFFQNFFLFLPFVFLWTPALLFFFNFATEVFLFREKETSTY